MPSGAEWIYMLAAYAVGCFTAAYYVVKWRTGADIRTLGSGNAGARNAGRALGRGGVAAVFALDFAKGAIVAGSARWLELGAAATAGTVLAVVAGHVWPAQLGFRGGKGVATSLGALACYDVPLLVSLLVAFVAVLLVLRRFTVSGLVAFALAPLGAALAGDGTARVTAGAALAALVLFAHRGNLRDELARIGRAGDSGPTETGSADDDHGP